MQALQKAGKLKRLGRPRKYKTNADRQRAYRKRLKRSVHFRSDSYLWSTPQACFNALDAEFGFTVDVCALPSNAKCAAFYSPEQDGLQQVWTGTCWCNPPYGSVITKWVQKACESSQSGATVVCLLPLRGDTRWWHNYVLPYAEVRYLKGRLKFGGGCNSAPFPSVVVIFRPIEPTPVKVTTGGAPYERPFSGLDVLLGCVASQRSYRPDPLCPTAHRGRAFGDVRVFPAASAGCV